MRGHVHFYNHIDKIRNGKPHHMATIPALQAMGSKFGARQCEGLIDFGLIYVECKGGVITEWQPLIVKIKQQKAEAIKL